MRRGGDDPGRRERRRGALGSLALAGVFLVPAVALAVMTSPGGSTPASAQTVRAYAQAANTDLVSAGKTLFLQTCSSCHGPLGAGTAQGPAILGLGPANYDFQMSTGRMPLAQPGTQGVRKPPVLTPAEIDAVIAYLTSLEPGGVPNPDVDPAHGDLSTGSRLYLANCAPCHSASGNGGSVGTQDAPSLHEATALQIGQAVRIGPGTMPVFDPRTITDQQLNSLAAYVLYLRNPEAPGGLDLGNYGPIVEGFVALVVGLAGIVVVSRYIGARSW
jgi:ubiquinol-cytochrome c reductase cytochrome c subunit